jgi:conjugal transfer/entry exclusion protein
MIGIFGSLVLGRLAAGACGGLTEGGLVVTFVLQTRESSGEPRWMGLDGDATCDGSMAKVFQAIPASGHSAFFVIEPPLPDDVWDQWEPQFFSMDDWRPFDVWAAVKRALAMVAKGRASCLLMVMLLAWGTPALAAIPVIDEANLVQNSITAVQSTISAVEAVIHTAKWIIEQTPLDEFVAAEELAEDLAQIDALVREAQALGYDIGALSAMIAALFSLESAPSTTTDLQMRLWEIRRQVHLGWSYALRTQSLIQTAIRTVSHALRLYEQMTTLLGNLAGHQNLSQQLTKLVQLETETKVSLNAFQLAQSMDRLTEPLVDESLFLINETIMATHPR